MKKVLLVCMVLLFVVSLNAAKYKPKLAVMEFEDRSETLSKTMLTNASDYLRGEFANANTFVLIAKERQQKVQIEEMKKESRKKCYDESCQIPLGQALSADTILRISLETRPTVTLEKGNFTVTEQKQQIGKIEADKALVLSADADVMVAYDKALTADEKGKQNPEKAERQWKILANMDGKNPFKEKAKNRAKEWQRFIEVEVLSKDFEFAKEAV